MGVTMLELGSVWLIAVTARDKLVRRAIYHLSGH